MEYLLPLDTSHTLNEIQTQTKIVFGEGQVDCLGDLAVELAAKRALVVSDPGIISAGHTGRAVDSLTAGGIEAAIFDGVEENPTTAHVETGVAFAKEFGPDLIIGVGGGSSMDCAKGINFVLSCGGTMHDYHGVGKATGPLLPMIAVPTTAGTGSEAQSFALISDAETHVKMACGDKRAAFKAAILDPRLTLTQPAVVTALTGIDAISHAIETYVTKRRNEVSQSLSREAWRLLSHNFPRVIESPDDLEARGGMQLGACFAGLAIENSMLGAAHALANPVTAKYGTPHGQAVGLMLPHVVRHNAKDKEIGQIYADLNEISGDEDLAGRLSSLLELAGLKTRLSDLAVDEGSLPELADEASQQWTGTFNPVPVDAVSLLQIYQSAW